MISLTPNAKSELDAFFKSHPEEPRNIRVYLTPGGCCGPRLAMALDDANDEDMTEEVEGYTFCMGSLLAMQTGEVRVDIGYMGFSLTPEHPLQSAASACGGGCSSCGSGSCGC